MSGVVEVRCEKAGLLFQAKLLSERGRLPGRSHREVQSENGCPTLGKCQRVRAEIASQVQHTFAGQVRPFVRTWQQLGEFCLVDPGEPSGARPQLPLIVEGTEHVDEDPFVPVRSVGVEPLARTEVDTAWGA
ncbi:MAG: hypothetical protein JWP90_1550 [Mycetocola sp.]|nr:hypothetical protein [Mycetocola sp.]